MPVDVAASLFCVEAEVIVEVISRSVSSHEEVEASQLLTPLLLRREKSGEVTMVHEG